MDGYIDGAFVCKQRWNSFRLLQPRHDGSSIPAFGDMEMGPLGNGTGGGAGDGYLGERRLLMAYTLCPSPAPNGDL